MFNDYVKERISKAVETLQRSGISNLIDKFQLEGEGITISIKFLTITIKDGFAHVITGTKQNPAGISTTDCDFVIFIEDGRIVKGMSIYDLKTIIRELHEELEQKLDKDYNHLGFLLPRDAIFSSSKAS